MNSTLLLEPQTAQWEGGDREVLCEFVRDVVGTPLKFKVLQLFLFDPYLCLSSDFVARRIGEQTLDVRQSVRELHAQGVINYCKSFAYSDLCCLAFAHRPPAVQHRLRLLRFALRIEPALVESLLSRPRVQVPTPVMRRM